MAPRPPEPLPAFLARLRAAADDPGLCLRFGQAHHTHAVCRAGPRWQVRRLELPAGSAEAFLREHGRFMPEDAEDLSVPGAVVLDAASLAELIAALEARPWPLR